MFKVLKDLALALLNATLILIALCLFLAWKTASTMDGLTETFAQNLQIVAPLRGDVQSMKEELSGLRQDLATLASQGGETSQVVLQRVQERVAAMDTRVTEVQSRIQSLADTPEVLLNQVIETSADAFARSVSEIRGCQPAG